VTDLTLASERAGLTPLDQYEPHGYVRETAERTDRERKALDAAVKLTASSWGPPFATAYDDAGVWWHPAYTAACRAVEDAIVDALVGPDRGDGIETDGGHSEGESEHTHYCDDCDEPLSIIWDDRDDESIPIVCGHCGGTNTRSLEADSEQGGDLA
jgi:hypothetical protein